MDSRGQSNAKEGRSTERRERANDGETRVRDSTLLTLEDVDFNPLENRERQKLDEGDEVRGSRYREGERQGNESPTWVLSDMLQLFGALKGQDERDIVERGNALVELLSNNQQLKNDLAIVVFVNKIQFMLVHNVSEVRALGYRLLRYAVTDFKSLCVLVQCRVLVFITLTMTGDASITEREQALCLIRQFLHINRGVDCLSAGVVKSIIAVIEVDEFSDPHMGDFQKVCFETLCEMTVIKPQLAFQSGAIRLLMSTVMDGELAWATDSFVVLTRILGSAKSRKYVRNGYDFRSLIAVFSENPSTQGDRFQQRKAQKIAFIITILLKNWNGFIGLSHNSFDILRDLILVLKSENYLMEDIVFDVLLDVLRVRPLPWLESSSIGETIRILKKKNDSKFSYAFEYGSLNPRSFEANFINHYLGLLTFFLIKNGAIKILVEIIEEGNRSDLIVDKATLLLTHLHNLASKLLPSDLVDEKLLLPPIIHEKVLHTLIYKVEKCTRMSFTPGSYPVKPILNYLKNLNVEHNYIVDDTSFKRLLLNTKVLAIKEFASWNWSLVSVMILGPIRNPERFSELLEKSPKFMKRVMSFYRPFKYRFSRISNKSRHAKKYISVGCQLLESLLSFSAGVKYLSSNKLLMQIAETFAQVNPFSGVSAVDPILGKHRLESTISGGYLKFIGVLSSNRFGVQLLEQWQFIQLFHDIILDSATSDTNNYLLLNLFNFFDYTVSDQFKLLLEKAVSVGNLKIRQFIVEKLLVRLAKTNGCEYFAIKILLNGIYDIDDCLCAKCVKLLYELLGVSDDNILDYVAQLKPLPLILSKYEHGRSILLTLMRNSKGIKFLVEAKYVDGEFERWLNLSASRYVSAIESMFSLKLMPYFVHFNSEDKYSIHFFNSLLLTEVGVNYFHDRVQTSYLEDLVKSIEELSMKIEDENHGNNVDSVDHDADLEGYSDSIFKLKRNLWIVGTIASSNYGIQLLDSLKIDFDNSVIRKMVSLFDLSNNWEIRGVAFYQLGRIANTMEGIEILDELNWCSVFDEFSNPLRLSYPKDILERDIFGIVVENPYQSVLRDVRFEHQDEFFSPEEVFEDIDDDEMRDETYLNEKVLNLVKYISSFLNKIVRTATKQLNYIKKTYPEIFENIHLFLKVLFTVDEGNYKYSARNFIFSLFNGTNVRDNLLKKTRKVLK